MLTSLIVTVVAAAAVFLLALVSDGFAYELSRAVEAMFDSAEYRLALRSSRRRRRAATRREPPLAYKVSRSHAG